MSARTAPTALDRQASPCRGKPLLPDHPDPHGHRLAVSSARIAMYSLSFDRCVGVAGVTERWYECRTDCVRRMASMWGRMEMGIVRPRDGSSGGGSAKESRKGPWQISHVRLPFSLIHRWMHAS